jgi:hypothetical protein
MITIFSLNFRRKYFKNHNIGSLVVGRREDGQHPLEEGRVRQPEDGARQPGVDFVI